MYEHRTLVQCTVILMRSETGVLPLSHLCSKTLPVNYPSNSYILLCWLAIGTCPPETVNIIRSFPGVIHIYGSTVNSIEFVTIEAKWREYLFWGSFTKKSFEACYFEQDSICWQFNLICLVNGQIQLCYHTVMKSRTRENRKKVPRWHSGCLASHVPRVQPPREEGLFQSTVLSWTS